MSRPTMRPVDVNDYVAQGVELRNVVANAHLLSDDSLYDMIQQSEVRVVKAKLEGARWRTLDAIRKAYLAELTRRGLNPTPQPKTGGPNGHND